MAAAAGAGDRELSPACPGKPTKRSDTGHPTRTRRCHPPGPFRTERYKGTLVPGRWQSQLTGRVRRDRTMTSRTPESEPLLTPAEVATMFRVDPKTVTRWAKSGKLTSIRTLGGHRRYRETEVRALLSGIPAPRDVV